MRKQLGLKHMTENDGRTLQMMRDDMSDIPILKSIFIE